LGAIGKIWAGRSGLKMAGNKSKKRRSSNQALTSKVKAAKLEKKPD
jgi:hypothetical protein